MIWACLSYHVIWACFGMFLQVEICPYMGKKPIFGIFNI